MACSGKQKAGVTRQYLGREGKVDLGQVGVGLSYYKDGMWALVDAGLYLPRVWFSEGYQACMSVGMSLLNEPFKANQRSGWK